MGDKEKMIDFTKEYEEQEKVSLGKTFIYFLLGVGAIMSIWLFSGLMVVFSRFGG